MIDIEQFKVRGKALWAVSQWAPIALLVYMTWFIWAPKVVLGALGTTFHNRILASSKNSYCKSQQKFNVPIRPCIPQLNQVAFRPLPYFLKSAAFWVLEGISIFLVMIGCLLIMGAKYDNVNGSKIR